VKLDDGRVWKRHINQIKAVGNQMYYNMLSDDIDHNGPINIANDRIVTANNTETKPISENFDLDSSRHNSEGSTKTAESEEGEAIETNVPYAASPPRASVSERRTNIIFEARPKRNRKPPDRYGDYLSSF